MLLSLVQTPQVLFPSLPHPHSWPCRHTSPSFPPLALPSQLPNPLPKYLAPIPNTPPFPQVATFTACPPPGP